MQTPPRAHVVHLPEFLPRLLAVASVDEDRCNTNSVLSGIRPGTCPEKVLMTAHSSSRTQMALMLVQKTSPWSARLHHVLRASKNPELRFGQPCSHCLWRGATAPKVDRAKWLFTCRFQIIAMGLSLAAAEQHR
jgi:hypothetical protein